MVTSGARKRVVEVRQGQRLESAEVCIDMILQAA